MNDRQGESLFPLKMSGRHKSMDQLEFEIRRSIVIMLLLTAKENWFTRLVVPDFKPCQDAFYENIRWGWTIIASQAVSYNKSNVYHIVKTSEKEFWVPPTFLICLRGETI